MIATGSSRNVQLMPASRPRKHRRVNGNDFLYRLFTDLTAGNDEAAAAIVEAAVESCAIWFPLDLYQRMPVLLPWVVRDPRCRPHKIGGVKSPDRWGSPNKDGYLRDDNSLVKGIPRSLTIQGGNGSRLHDTRLGESWTAAHVWRKVRLSTLATRDSRLNTFVPNLVWLPEQLAKLSDREGSAFQNALKRRSFGLFRNRKVHPSLTEHVEAIWKLIPEPDSWTELPNVSVNQFLITERFLSSRTLAYSSVVRLCEAAAEGRPLPPKGRLTSRYYEGVTKVPRKALATLVDRLKAYSVIE